MTSKTEPSIPVARNNLVGCQTGILNEGQKLWTRAKPNERDIENPVLKKYVILEAILLKIEVTEENKLNLLLSL